MGLRFDGLGSVKVSELSLKKVMLDAKVFQARKN